MHTNEWNRGQSDAIRHADGPCVVIAPPGSGKTFVLTARINELVKARGIPPQHILVLTFTRAAAEQMRGRYLAMTGETGTKTVFGTFHSVFLQILRQSLQMGAVLPDMYTDRVKVISGQAKKRILTSIVNCVRDGRERVPDTERLCEYIAKRKNRAEAESDSQTQGDVRPESGSQTQGDVRTESGSQTQGDVRRGSDDQIRSGSHAGTELDEEILEFIFREYCAECRRQGYLDFEDITVCCARLFGQKRNEKLLHYWQERFSYILIDEFQDISPAQFGVIRLLAQPRQNLFVVGDDDQAIYGFRGSKPRLMLELPNYYPEIRTLYLEMNYRSGERIVSAAGRLIRHNKLRYVKTVLTGREEKGLVRAVVCPDKERQEHVLLKSLMGRPSGESLAVIVRTNAQAAYYRRMMEREGIRCAAERTENVYQHPAAKDVLAYLRLARAQHGQLEDMLLVANKPYRGIARGAMLQCAGSIGALCDFYEGNMPVQRQVARWKEQLRMLRQLPPSAAVAYIQKGIGYQEFLLREWETAGEAKEEAVQILERLKKDAQEFAGWREWMEYIENEREKKMESAERPSQSSGIRIITMHACKGLEYDHVVIPDINEGMMPYKRAFLPEDIEEERRLLYVAMTRAKKTLLMTCIHQQGNPKMQMSAFMKEITGYVSDSSSSDSSNSSKASSSRYSS